MMRSQKLIKKAEKDILSEYLTVADFSEPPPGFDIKAHNSVNAVRLIHWRTCDVIHKTFLFKAHVSGYNYVAIGCYTKDKESGMLTLHTIDALYRNGKW